MRYKAILAGYFYHINRHMYCCIRTRRIGTKGKKGRKGGGEGLDRRREDRKENDRERGEKRGRGG